MKILSRTTQKTEQSINELLERLHKPTLKLDDLLSLVKGKQLKYLTTKAFMCIYVGARRAGKTVANLLLIILYDLFVSTDIPARIVIASYTIGKVRGLYWNPLNVANKILRLGWQFKNQESMIITKNNEIVFRGLKDMPSANMDIGYKIKMAIIEELHTIKEDIVKHYIENVITHGTVGIPRATIRVTANSPIYHMPYYEGMYENPEIEVINTSMWDNPYYSKETVDEYALKISRKLGYQTIEEARSNHAGFARDLFGDRRLDSSMLVFPDYQSYAFYDSIPDYKEMIPVMGIDIGGGSAKDAIVVLLYSQYENQTYLDYEEEIDTADEDLEKLATATRNVHKNYHDLTGRWASISIDTGGIGKRVAMALRNRYSVPNVIPAEKRDKMTFLREFKTELLHHRIKLKRDSTLYTEFKQIVYTDKKDKIDDERGLHSDLLDASLYAMRYLMSQFYKKRPKVLTPNEKAIEEFKRNRRPKRDESRYDF